MEAVIKLVVPFFSTPKNYGQVLTKLAGFAFYETYFITLLLRANPRFDAFYGHRIVGTYRQGARHHP
jgi:hypothetical protein